ncbi:FHA domain-containing protein [Streptomyces sp. G-G2]|uniref:FHA domain-containing protein n=1 Tax=Streptomyces sp. G-G2 TaxID=3046201 RepID=UPI0024BA8E99|nr:FHA domain-containing protein [Streptomyces sp. G-G2]MDJ0379780.1 FHA domain-containing protein [Streptomyces sp. G-G2]
MPTCPNGHQSVSDDWCEVCGHRMAPPAAPAGAPEAPVASSYDYGFPMAGGEPTAQAELCPQCRTPREAMAPYCEECRFNFLTRTATSYTPLAPNPATSPGPVPGHGAGPGHGPGPGGATGAQPLPTGEASYASHDPYEYRDSRPSQVNRPAEALQREDDWLLPPPAQEPQAPYYEPPAPQPDQYQGQQPDQYQGQQQGQQQNQPQGHGGGGQPYAEQGGAWTATIGPDRSYFMAMMQRSGPEAAGLNLPAYSPEQHLPLSGGQITIGRRRVSTGESPDVDLSVPPEDPGVSHAHAVLVQQPDGSWAVVDQNSTNGTYINMGEDPIQPYVPVPLRDGDRVHVGAWTTVTVRRA